MKIILIISTFLCALSGIVHAMDIKISKPTIITTPQSHNTELYKIDAQHNTNTIGYIEYKIKISHPNGYISRLFVEKNNRKQGIATQLLNAACIHMKEQGCQKVTGISLPLGETILSTLLSERYGGIILYLSLINLFNVTTLATSLDQNYKNILIHLRRKAFEYRLSSLGHLVSLPYLLHNHPESTFPIFVAYSLFSSIKFAASRDAFYKQFGAKINFFSRTASFDLQQNTELTMQPKKKIPSKL